MAHTGAALTDTDAGPGFASADGSGREGGLMDERTPTREECYAAARRALARAMVRIAIERATEYRRQQEQQTAQEGKKSA